MPTLPLDSDQLRVFVAFADEGGFSAAARALGRSQPAVHARIQALQDDLGVPLYARVGRGVHLTEAGREVAAYGRRQLGDVAALRRRLSGGGTPRVQLMSGAGVLRDLLADGLAAFVEAGGRIDVGVGSREAVVAAVRDGRAHLGVTALSEAPTGVWARPLCSVSLCVAVRQDHPLAQLPRLGLADLLPEALILPPPGGPVRTALAVALPTASLQDVVTCRGWDATLALVAAGAGVGLVNNSCAPPPGVRLVVLDAPELPVTHYWVLARPGGPRGEARRLANVLHATEPTRRFSRVAATPDGAQATPPSGPQGP